MINKKFRVWCPTENKYLDNVVLLNDGTVISYIYRDDSELSGLDEDEDWELEWYIGYEDCNGKPICVGDIVTYHIQAGCIKAFPHDKGFEYNIFLYDNYNISDDLLYTEDKPSIFEGYPDTSWIYAIITGKVVGGYDFRVEGNSSLWSGYDGNPFIWSELEIIGNIRETPELLKDFQL